jgi:hypothetical protein
MSALSIQPTFPIFTDIDGQPLEAGYIWIGVANLDPQTNPTPVYWDAALTILAPQPIRTLAGYPSNNGTPARLYVNSDYSIRVMNRNGSTVYSAPSATERYSDVVISEVNAEDVAYDPPFTNAVSTNVEAKLAQTISVKDFGALGDGVANDASAIQNAIDAVNTNGGGKVFFPEGKYNLGTTGLIVYQNIILSGEVTRYGGNTTRGVSLIYAGSGAAIFGENILDAQILDFDIDCTGATGTYPTGRGIYLNGCWKSTLRNVTVRGLTLTKGYAIAIDTNSDAFGPPSPSNAWGAQHNYLEQIEVPDGTILFEGAGANDGVTTTVCNTIRGHQYEIASSQIVFINSTAEGWSTGAGFTFYGPGCYGLLLGCDIEGSGSPGINVGGFAEVREVGTIWAGFSGAVRVGGTDPMAPVRSYGGRFEFTTELLSANTPASIMAAGNQNLGAYISDYLVPTDLVGGTQTGHRLWRRFSGGTEYTDHDWQQHAFVQKAISTSSTSATTIFTIPVPNGSGLKLSAHAAGTQLGDAVYSNSRGCNVINTGGTLTIVQDTQVTCGSSSAISFVASGSSVLVQWTPTTVNASAGNMNLEIRGPWTSYI